MKKTLWDDYAEAWSMPGEGLEGARGKRLAACVAPDVSYTDPLNALQGAAALCDYMAGFQSGFPGARFRINDVHQHHERCLARWDPVGADGGVIHDGASFARLDAEGRLAEITGFFDPPSA